MINNINHLNNSNKDLAFIKFSLNSFFGELSNTTPDAAEISDILLKFKIDLIIILNLRSKLNLIKPI